MATGGSINTDILSDETFDLLCTICKRKGRNREAEKYCVDCNDYYCITCVKVHEDVPLLSGHMVLDQGQFSSGTSNKLSKGPRGSSQGQPAAPTERCDKHSHYYIDMYCQNHDDVGCATCMAVDHRLCHDTFYIPEFLQNNTSTPAPKETQQILGGVAKILTEHHDNLKHRKQQLLKAKAESLENIRKFRKQINDRLDIVEQNSVDEIESIYKALVDEIEEAIKVLQTNKTNIRTAKDKVGCPSSNISQAFVNVKKGNRVANMVSKCTEDNKAQIQLLDIDFKADQTLRVLLVEMNTLGMIIQRNIKNEKNTAYSTCTTQHMQDTSSRHTRQKKYPATSNVQQRNTLYRVIGKSKYSVKVQPDKDECNIVSACALEDGTIILSDNRNMRLKRLDGFTYTIKDYCNLTGYPWQVCPISDQEVAVCLPEKHVVQFISVGSRLKKAKAIKTDFKCSGLAYANGKLYISYFTSVYIYSVSGSKLRQFSVDQLGQELFCNINSLSVSRDGSKIYVSDFSIGLIVLDNSGQVVGQFNGAQLKGAYGCFLTHTGCLLVCGRDRGNVLQFRPDGEFIGKVVKSNETALYQAVSCNQESSKMIVGSWSNDNIEVYDLA